MDTTGGVIFSSVVDSLSSDAVVVYAMTVALRARNRVVPKSQRKGIDSINEEKLGWPESRWQRAWEEYMGSDEVLLLLEIGDESVVTLSPEMGEKIMETIDARALDGWRELRLV